MSDAYQNLSRCRSELMGLAALWVMLFHAYSLSFLHPRTMKRMTFFAPLDDYFLDLLRFYYR